MHEYLVWLSWKISTNDNSNNSGWVNELINEYLLASDKNANSQHQCETERFSDVFRG